MITVGILVGLSAVIYGLWTNTSRGTCRSVGLTGAKCVLTSKHAGNHIYGRR